MLKIKLAIAALLIGGFTAVAGPNCGAHKKECVKKDKKECVKKECVKEDAAPKEVKKK